MIIIYYIMFCRANEPSYFDIFLLIFYFFYSFFSFSFLLLLGKIAAHDAKRIFFKP